MILEETYTLANGLDIPKLGLSTWFIDDGDAAQAGRDAAAIGYRHIGTAQAYGNEAGVGDGIRSCGVPMAPDVPDRQARCRGEDVRRRSGSHRPIAGVHRT